MHGMIELYFICARTTAQVTMGDARMHNALTDTYDIIYILIIYIEELINMQVQLNWLNFLPVFDHRC
jgi:hypothetical protein